MSIDLSKLTPAPWTVVEAWSDFVGHVWEIHGPNGIAGKFLSKEDAEEAARSRNALDVMMRRGWSPERNIGGTAWAIRSANNYIRTVSKPGEPVDQWPDPFTALVEADRWYRERVEGAK